MIAAFLTPAGFLLAGSLRQLGGPPPRGFDPLPGRPSLDAYRRLAELLPLGNLIRTSTLVVAIAVPLTVVIASWAGFALAQLPRRPRRLLVGATVVLLVVPLPLVWVSRFALYVRLGVLDTLVPLVAPALAASTPFTVLLAYRAFRRVPPEIWQAARLEGSGALGTWWRVGLPMVPATTTAIAAVAFAFHWGNYLDALLYVQARAEATLPLGVGELATLDTGLQPVLLAGAVVLALPPLLVLALAQRRLLAALDSSPAV